MSRFVLFFFFFTIPNFSQKTITGVISDTLNIPLESANVIAKPLQEKATIKFAIADNKGRFKLELDANVKYEIIASYIGYVEQIFVIESDATLDKLNFKLSPTGENLKEIIIKHDYKPIIIKKDTMTFNISSFANGQERKMKEVLEKLPGVEVDKNGGVTVQGKKVTQMLVEGKPFFGGGSKLAVENIPADALDQIEVIDNFNQVGFMKEVSGSEDLAMNVKLKKDKKKFIFGDIEAGAEVGNGDNNYVLAHAALFYYSPKTDVSFIGDANTIGESTFSFADLNRFDGGTSSFLSGRKSLTNLYSFTNENTDVVQNKSQFAATNFSHETSDKLSISGYSIFSKVLMSEKTNSVNTYFQNDTEIIEQTFQNSDNRSVLNISNIKFDYSPNKTEKLYYNAQYKSATNDLDNTINSITNTNQNTFTTLKNADNIGVKQYLEWHKQINKRHTTTFVVNHAFDNNKPNTDWFTNRQFLQGLIPLQQDNIYQIQQTKKIISNSIDALFKHYWIINNFNHLYTNIGNNFETTSLQTSEQQLLSDGNINNFSFSGFGNDIQYNLNDAYVGFEYKFKIGKWTGRPGLYLHFYNLKTKQLDQAFAINKTLLQPQFNSEYEFNKSESLTFNYRLANQFPEVTSVANGFTLINYNVVFKGNALLQNQQYHTANLSYRKTNLYKGITLYATANFNKKSNTIRNEINLDGINQFNTPILTDNPETNWRFNNFFTKKIYRFTIGLNTNLSWFNYFQEVNNIINQNERRNQNLELSFKTSYRKWPDFKIAYNKGFSQFSGITNSNFSNDRFTTDFGIVFLKYFTLKGSYENFKNTDNNGQSNYFEIANASLVFHKKNSPLSFEMTANNFLNNKTRNSYNFSDFIINQSITFILPRILLFSIAYKL